MGRRLKKRANEFDEPDDRGFTLPIDKEAEKWVNPTGTGQVKDVPPTNT